MKCTKIIISVFLLVLISCKEQSKKQTSVIQNKILKETNNSTNSDSLSRKVVYNFYKWYINDVYLKRIEGYDYAPYKKYGANKYGLDIEAYESKLEEISFFSNSFKLYLIDINKKCNQEMLKEYWDSNPNDEGGSFNIPSCQFRWNYRWFGSQEGENNKFTILDNFSKENNTYKYLVQTFMYGEPFTKYEVIVVKENGLFKINSINSK